jgi:hypothetical protein
VIFWNEKREAMENFPLINLQRTNKEKRSITGGGRGLGLLSRPLHKSYFFFVAFLVAFFVVFLVAFFPQAILNRQV